MGWEEVVGACKIKRKSYVVSVEKISAGQNISNICFIFSHKQNKNKGLGEIILFQYRYDKEAGLDVIIRFISSWYAMWILRVFERISSL